METYQHQLDVHVNDVVTDCSHALAEFIVLHFLVLSLANLSNVSHCKCFFSSIPFLFSVQ